MEELKPRVGGSRALPTTQSHWPSGVLCETGEGGKGDSMLGESMTCACSPRILLLALGRHRAKEKTK